MNYTMKLSKKLSFGEEIANSVTHAVGALLMLILLPISAVYSFEQHGLLSAFGTSIFVISLFLMFLFFDRLPCHVLRFTSKVCASYYRSFHDLHCDRRWLHTSCPHLNEQLDGLQHYLDPMGTTIFGILYKIFAKSQ